MSIKKETLKFVEPVKKQRVEFSQIGVARLFKKRNAKPFEAKGVIIRPLTAEGKEDFTADGYLIWLSAIEAMRQGVTNTISVFLVKYEPRPDKVE